MTCRVLLVLTRAIHPCPCSSQYTSQGAWLPPSIENGCGSRYLGYDADDLPRQRMQAILRELLGHKKRPGLRRFRRREPDPGHAGSEEGGSHISDDEYDSSDSFINDEEEESDYSAEVEELGAVAAEIRPSSEVTGDHVRSRCLLT